LDDVVEQDGKIRRVCRSEVLGSVKAMSKPQARRELDKRVGLVNDENYRPQQFATFEEVGERWMSIVLESGAFKLSTRATISSQETST
jgi:hypothetical protein